MKCIKLVTGVVIRVKDEEAAVVVEEGEAIYCSKSEWKAQGRLR